MPATLRRHGGPRLGAAAPVIMLAATLSPSADASGQVGSLADSHQSPARVAPHYRITGPMQLSELYIGGTFLSETETVWRYMCGSDWSGRTGDDLRRIAADMNHQMSDPGVRVVDSGMRGVGLNLVFNIGASVPSEALPAIQFAETFIESKFHDPVDVAINIAYGDLGPGVIGATGSNYKTASYSITRSSLADFRDDDDFLQPMLPFGSTIPVRYDGSGDVITDESRVFFTYANHRAAIGSVAGVAASMTFNTQFAFDYDPSDGVNGTSFTDVIIHEVGHALGFTSGVDFRTTDIEALDLYRFPLFNGDVKYNPDNSAEFFTFPRLQDFNTPNGQHMSDLLQVEYRMEDGTPWQASHFREQSQVIGIMDPALGQGETLYPDYFLQSDLNMFDAIGWDYPGPVSDCPPPVLLLVSTQEQVVCLGDIVVLEVEFAPGQAGDVQWRRGDTPIVDDGAHIVGAESSTLFILGLKADDAGDDYNCVATSACGSTYVSENMSLILGDGAIISDQPDDLTVQVGDPAVFSVSAAGVSLTYQWQRDGVDLIDDGRILGATDSQLVILSAELDDAGEYICRIDSLGPCTVPTDPATLTVGDDAPCPEDLNGDGFIGQQDLGVLLASYGIDDGGDINGDGVTDQSDLGLVLAVYDTPCP